MPLPSSVIDTSVRSCVSLKNIQTFPLSRLYLSAFDMRLINTCLIAVPLPRTGAEGALTIRISMLFRRAVWSKTSPTSFISRPRSRGSTDNISPSFSSRESNEASLIGLPGETDGDVEGICRLIRHIIEVGRQCTGHQ